MEKKIRVLHLLPLGGIGGAEKFVLSLCRHHDKSRFEVFVCVLFPFSGYRVVDEIAALGHQVIKLGMSNGFDIIRAVKLISIIRELKIDLIDVHGQNPLGKLCSLLSSASVVIHTDHGTTVGSPIKRKRRVVFSNRLMMPFIDGFIAISEGMRQSLRFREKVSENKITLLYNGVDVEAISSASVDKKMLKRTLGIAVDIPVLGTVGRLVAEKQYPLLLEGLVRLKKEHLDFVTLIIGEGPQRSSLEGEIHALNLQDRVRLLGERTDVINLLDCMDVFAFSSGGEAFSITILEAMAKAKPIVAFDVEGVNEAVVSGETGYLVPYKNIDSFADKIKLLLQSPELARKLGSRGHARACALFDIKENIRKTERLFERVLNRG